ncbi:hypothetical protein HK099_003350 [Clydaea vesicula]|uniref:Malate dehydrogenase n=1 Tax=Clydaea vesicula TaxID=447962 RepID=A0AAD5UB06_9FUNG|nr:hypothetical protein HK099_003350 [Clydaea vesicula]KAJ3381424.1 hypothetical protein HDU92_005334 [Lobulomyces angularis]
MKFTAALATLLLTVSSVSIDPRNYQQQHVDGKKSFENVKNLFPALVPANAKLADAYFASGTQNYVCDSTTKAYKFAGPVANLFKNGKLLGTHYNDLLAGPPHWQFTKDSSLFIGAKAGGVASPLGNTLAVDWLLLNRTNPVAKGKFGKTKFIIRADTQGGVKPSAACVDGEKFNVPYTTSYLFLE